MRRAVLFAFTSVIVRIVMTTLVYYPPEYRRDLGEWRRDCSCAVDISSW